MTVTAPPHDAQPAGPRWATPAGPAVDPPAPAVRQRRLPWPRRDPVDARWVRPGVVGLLAATAVLYIWGLGASGWANSFYSAAAQAGSQG